jgi:ATP-dependent DNA ligase
MKDGPMTTRQTVDYTPQLPTEVSEKRLEALLSDDRWVMSQKLDGHRFVVQTGPVNVYNRHGEERTVPKELDAALGWVTARWILDGEWLDNTLHVFDIISTSRGSVASWPWETRQKLLGDLIPKIALKTEAVTLVQQVYGAEAKKELFDRCRNNMVEGVVFALADAKYHHGKRTDTVYKYKFIKEVDCFVINKGLDGKDNLEIAMYDDGSVVSVGRVSALTGDGPKVKVGDVVTVKVLYSTEAGRLFHPVKPRLRTDKRPIECTFDQVEAIKTNKEIQV